MIWRTCRDRTPPNHGSVFLKAATAVPTPSANPTVTSLLQALYVLGNGLRLLGGNAIDALAVGSLLAGCAVLDEFGDVYLRTFHCRTNLACAIRTMTHRTLRFVDRRAIFGGPGQARNHH